MVQIDMEMPKRCFDCLIEEADDWTRNYECPLVYKGYTGKTRMTGRLAECPLRDVQPETYDLTTNIENVLSLLNGINSSGRMDYSDYCALYDAIEGFYQYKR